MSVSGSVSPPPRVSTKRKLWNEETMESALQEVRVGNMSVRRAAVEYGVPKSTLHDRVSGKVLPGSVGGAPRYLEDEEEEELVKWLKGCAEVGYAKSVKEVCAIVGGIVSKKRGLEHFSVTHGWWDRFRSRHPNLTLRAGESLAYVRAASTSRQVIDHYFKMLEDVIEKNHLIGKPGRIFNCDESGIPLQHRPGRRIALKGQKHVNVLTSGNKSNITVLACISASGCAITPMVIYNRKNLTPELTKGEIEGTIYGLSSSGWIDAELFLEWFNGHFLQYAPSVRPLLLLLDGHSSHYGPDFIYRACEEGVIVFCLPPHTTHICQPLDSTCFHSLKLRWDQECDRYMAANPGKMITIYQFTQLFSGAWRQAMTPENIISSFRATGVYPVNRRAVVIPGEEKPPSTPTACLAKKKGINFMPFYSPSSDDTTPKFSLDELELFERRYREGYDLTGDDRYNLWVRLHKPQPQKPQLQQSLRVQLFSTPAIDEPLSSSLSPITSPNSEEYTPLQSVTPPRRKHSPSPSHQPLTPLSSQPLPSNDDSKHPLPLRTRIENRLGLPDPPPIAKKITGSTGVSTYLRWCSQFFEGCVNY